MYVVTALAVALAALIATQLDPTVKAHRDSTCSRDSQAFLLRDWWYGEFRLAFVHLEGV